MRLPVHIKKKIKRCSRQLILKYKFKKKNWVWQLLNFQTGKEVVVGRVGMGFYFVCFQLLYTLQTFTFCLVPLKGYSSPTALCAFHLLLNWMYVQYICKLVQNKIYITSSCCWFFLWKMYGISILHLCSIVRW
jgi:hypothetical protein